MRNPNSGRRSVCSPRQAPLCHSMTSSRRNFPQHMFASPKRPLPDMVKTSDELALMRVSGKLLASVFGMLDEQDLAGMSTLQVNDLVDRFITVELAARPASKGQYGFKFVLNSSINHVVCHGVPDADEIVRDGDIINLDITLEKHDFIRSEEHTSA